MYYIHAIVIIKTINSISKVLKRGNNKMRSKLKLMITKLGYVMNK